MAGLRPQLERLKPFFKADASAELRGCFVAMGEEGAKLMTFLADVWGVPVVAGETLQYGTKWDFPVRTAEPGTGKITIDSGSFWSQLF